MIKKIWNKYKSLKLIDTPKQDDKIKANVILFLLIKITKFYIKY